MSISAAIAMFGVMLALAFIPGISVLTVAARAAAHGFPHGVITSLGIVTGDIIYIVIAILGLGLVAGFMESFVILIKLLGSAYLIWLASGLLGRQQKVEEVTASGDASLMTSYLSGLIITLADQKAVLFYLVFFPAFIDLSTMGFWDSLIIIILAGTAILIAKLVYAWMVIRTRFLLRERGHRIINLVAGLALLLVGSILITQSL